MSCSSTSTEWPYYHYYEPPYNNNSVIIQDSLSHSTQTKKCRGSKKTPATIFNADAANFRTLVQQLTGRPSAPTVLGAQKGPVTISFSQDKNVDQLDIDASSSTMLPFGYRNYGQYIIAPKNQEKQHVSMNQDMHGEDTKLSSSNGQSCVATSSSLGVVVDPSDSLDLFDNFDIDRCLEDLDWVASSNNNGND